MRRAWFALALIAACSQPREPAHEVSVGEALSSDADARFARAIEPRAFEFPRDHGPHEEFQTEWWYFTGNVEDDSGRGFGYQLTFFRRALEFEQPTSESRWAARDVYMAHFALSDVGADEFHSFERFSRGALELAGARTQPWRVWLRDWSVEGSPEKGARLVARDGDFAIELEVSSSKPEALHGDAGLSRKGHEPGNSSFYYSLTRLDTRGRITAGGREYQVHGSSWFDREWSTSALEPGQVGWDWFALQLDDGRELMLYRMRKLGGSVDDTSSGSLIDEHGAVARLARDDVTIDVLARWRSEASGSDYPARWRVRLASAQLEVEVEPLLADQELRHSVHYWEGAVRVVREGKRVGRGYVELTGY